jgi:hypothetical protein
MRKIMIIALAATSVSLFAFDRAGLHDSAEANAKVAVYIPITIKAKTGTELSFSKLVVAEPDKKFHAEVDGWGGLSGQNVAPAPSARRASTAEFAVRSDKALTYSVWTPRHVSLGTGVTLSPVAYTTEESHRSHEGIEHSRVLVGGRLEGDANTHGEFAGKFRVCVYYN